MFGLAGYFDRWHHQLCGMPGRLSRLLHEEDRRRVGICCQQDTIYYALAERQGETVRLLQLAQEKRQPSGQDAVGILASSWEPESGDAAVQDVVAGVLMGLARQGWQQEKIVCCLSTDKLRCFLLDLPRQMTQAECREAAYWEVDGRLMEEGLAAEDFCLSWHLPEEGRAFALGVPRADVAHLEQQGRMEGLRICGWVTGIPEGLTDMSADDLILQETLLEGRAGLREQDIPGASGAVGAALWGLGRPTPFVLGLSSQAGGQGPQLAWRRLAAAAAALTLMLLLVWGGFLGIRAWQARGSLQDAQKQLLALTLDRKAMQVLEAARQGTAARDTALRQLSKDAVPWYSLLLYLGSPPLTVEGIWLQDVKPGRDHSLELSGTALTYAALSEYMEAFQQESLPFGTPLLEKAERQEGSGRGGIRFHLVLNAP
ncbi:PilN domain-containing protein [uncultured Mitsuokella sp.]|uniref:PilN domain-containing protein n=1 Tax=uncultured Mitsuokella sp. TaxID=453120 RepID=UPI0026DD04AC|nr:PilN domain-containing protein [uncultured Mitsuokella sp.]